MNALAARRRHPAALLILLMAGLLVTGGLYALLAPKPASAARLTADDVQEGARLFQANCATCHGLNGEGGKGGRSGPSLVGVGAAAVDFQVGTGRMPMANNTVQVKRNTPQFDQKEIDQMAAYVASLGAGPAVPAAEYLDVKAQGVNLAEGGEIFRVNCAMCHNYAGAGGALTRGKFAPPLMGVQEKHIYEAMLTGPQSMPVFNDTNISPEAKRNVIAYLKNIETSENLGGNNLGNLGPVGEGYFLWLLALPIMVGLAVWLGRKAA